MNDTIQTILHISKNNRVIKYYRLHKIVFLDIERKRHAQTDELENDRWTDKETDEDRYRQIRQTDREWEREKCMLSPIK